MKNKKTLMCLSAIMIVIFHLWIPVFSNNVYLGEVEKYLRYICFIGVDIFFFISASSIASRNIDYKEFIKNRFINIYLKFIIFTIIMIIYKKLDIYRFINIIFGIEFFEKSGGSFLWFIPAIMILYIIMPIYKKLDEKHNILMPIIVIITFIIYSLFINYKTISIFINRIPIFMLGFYFTKYKVLEKLFKNKKVYILTSILLFIFGLFISYNCYKNNITFSFINDSYYLLNIPLTLGLILLIDLIKSNNITNILGKISLELYGFQMIFGFKIANSIYSLLDNSLITNIGVFIVLVLISIIFNFIFNKIISLGRKK